jgi:hypothetical protein
VTAPVPQPLQYKKLSRPWIVSLDSTALGSTTPTYVALKGKRSVMLGVSETTADTTDAESEGWTSEIIAARSWEIVFEYQETGTIVAGERVADPGQEIAKAKALTTGEDAQVRVKMQYGTDGGGFVGYANVKWSGTGGSSTDGIEGSTFTFSSAGPLLPFAAADA